MMRPLTRAAGPAFATFALLLAFAAVAPAAEPVRYELRLGPPNTHLVEITIRAAGLDPARGAEFAMPAWAPGSYNISDYAKMVQEFRAERADGRALEWRKTDKQTWRVELAGAREAVVRYKLYGNTLANNWVQYNDRHLFLAGPAAWMYLVGGKERPTRLVIPEVPAGWRIATGCARAGENTFTAADYDTFADCPIEIADFKSESFTHAGTEYHVVVHDIVGGKDFSSFTSDTRKLVEVITAMYGPRAPFDEYWFLFHIWPGTGGGLEHKTSTRINFSTDWDSRNPAGRFGTDYELKLFVTAHEFYHAWNVKRLRPAGLGPFDYTREVHTPSLWLSEGLTSYYGELALVRAGLTTPEQYLASMSTLLTGYEALPGRVERSLEEVSWDTWFRATPPGDTNLPNTNYSYYDGGQVVGHILDFAIREATGNRRSLDDAMRLLYERHALPRPGFTPADVVGAINEVAGRDLSELYRNYIAGKEPLPYERYFAYAGIAVERVAQSDRAWLGAELDRTGDGWARVRRLAPGGPAERAGLFRGDVILEADGQALGFAELFRRLETLRPGATLKLTVRRWGEPVQLEVTLGASPYPTIRLRPAEDATLEQRAVFRSWMGQPQR
jgi:predicted metalloprotease with PDZ domain